MENVKKFPSAVAAEALDVLEQAWAYYMPLPKPACDLDSKDQPQNFSYYEAA